LLTLEFALGVGSIGTLALLWEYAQPLGIPFLENLPPLSAIGKAGENLLTSHLYWDGWRFSVQRIVGGFLIAQVVGIPIGLIMAMNRASFETMFPIVEILRPIPPVAWIPISIIFWPTRELSVLFIVFLGAFWIVVLNTIGGASNIDPNYKRAALSLGSKPSDMFWRVILPATVPSIVTGMTVGIGIAWEMVVAAEMVAGRTGLGYLLWQSFEINAIAQCIICMISIGLAGFLSSQLVRLLGSYIAPWQRRL
jgi:NitT/TauT family transport system permease protein